MSALNVQEVAFHEKGRRAVSEKMENVSSRAAKNESEAGAVGLELLDHAQALRSNTRSLEMEGSYHHFNVNQTVQEQRREHFGTVSRESHRRLYKFCSSQKHINNSCGGVGKPPGTP